VGAAFFSHNETAALTPFQKKKARLRAFHALTGKHYKREAV